MELIERIEDLRPYQKAVVTIGNFDGVHLGHQFLLHKAIETADAVDGTSIAMTFEPHPIRVLTQNEHPPLLTLLEQKMELIESSGIDVLICLPFTRAFASMAAQKFVKDILIGRIGMHAIVIGKDYTFGKKRAGNLDLLQAMALQLNFEVIVADWIYPRSNGQSRRISSTRIRDLIIDGKMTKAKALLGRHYQIRGVVAQGRDRGGKLLGFPTANINLTDELCPKMGVYAVTVELADKRYKGVANIGYSPTFDDHIFTVEVHILDFDEQIYGQSIRVNFIRRIRDEIKFNSVAELAEQIHADIRKGREILSDS
jgi:riboflavin kinase/FMN adenylyltransferase